ncbi:sensor histidine kinase [Actinomadura rupiterrae]|uniref:sensor histidine kinase n=1 Tax=Actinomadura rupiterrae TaxID=559627 RepID=UPI0020A31042|nr:histidine kinase [Actinomadura rupiterrae]MCP2343805.1 signal transduction histidine kinase [Actinomadura rupiterrae]
MSTDAHRSARIRLAALRSARLRLPALPGRFAGIRGVRARFAGRPRLTDVALGGGLSLFDAVTLSTRHPAPSALGVLLWAGQTVPLLWRRRWPRSVLVVMTALFVLFEALDAVPGKTPGPYFLIFGVYAVARYRPAGEALAATGAAAVAAMAGEVAAGHATVPRLDSLNPDTATAFVAYFVVAFLLGYGRRRIDADARRMRELNERLRAERETNARQAVIAERARIAGELHDVVAHHVSAIAVQARSTEDVLADDPELALRGVSRIAGTADTALVEMRRILGLLAVAGQGEGAEPSLAHLDRLVQAAEAAGCRVTASADPAAQALPAAAQASAYRVVREAITNVLKHAGRVEVRLDVRCNASELRIEVENGPPGDDHRPVPGSGHGLVGMRERVAAFGGTLDTGPAPDGGWRVAAAFPLEEGR